jgi:hypothetical protein
MVDTVLVSGCYCCRFWLFKYLFLVVLVALGFYSCFFGCYRSIPCCALLQYSFLVIAVFISGSKRTRFWLLQYSFLVATVLFFGCYGYCLWLLNYLFLVFNSIFFLMVL